MNRLISIRVPADSVYGRICDLLMLAVLFGLSLAIGGTVVDFVMIQNVGLGLFLVAASALLAMVPLARHFEHSYPDMSALEGDSDERIQN